MGAYTNQLCNANDFINAKSHDGKKPLHAGLTTSYDENFFYIP